MSARPWYKRYPSDALNGKIGLELDERGAYDTILDMIYDRLGRVPDDSRYISGCCGCSMRKWNALRGKLIEKGKIFINNGEIHNKRADFELAITLKTSRKRAESGAKGGYNSGETRRASSKNKDIAEANNDSLARARSPEITSKKKTVTASHQKRTVRASRIPDDWHPPSVVYRWAMEKYGYTQDRLHEIIQEFVDYWRAESGQRATKLRWDLTFKNRIRYLGQAAKGRAGPTSVAKAAQELLQEQADASNGRTDHGAADGPVIDLADEDYGAPGAQGGTRRISGSS